MTPDAVRIMTAPHKCRVRWKRTNYEGGAPWYAEVHIGTLPDGRWYVWVIGQWTDDKARLYATEAEARGVAERWKQRIGGGWEQIPCDSYSGWRDGEQETPPPAG